MQWTTTLLAVVLVSVAWLLGQREVRQYRASREIGSDLFVYSRWRLFRRLTGVALLLALAVTLTLFDLLPPKTPRGATLYMATLVGEVLVLLVLPIFDLWETARTAKPGKGVRAKD